MKMVTDAWVLQIKGIKRGIDFLMPKSRRSSSKKMTLLTLAHSAKSDDDRSLKRLVDIKKDENRCTK
jgi:hypothetical protein